jgi:SAM-dependent methyltransferase
MPLDYSDISRTYDDYRAFPEEIFARVMRLGGISQASKALEFGCGTGTASAGLRARCGADVIGMDRSPGMLRRAAAKGVPVIRSDADGRSFPLKSSIFDAVLGIYVIHHIADLERLFSECHRVLERGSLVLLTSSHSQIRDQHPAVKHFFPSFVNIDVGRFPDIPRVDAALESAGFEGIEHEEISIRRSLIDEAYLAKVKNRYISTYELIPDEEFRSGVRGLEAYIKGLKAPEYRVWRATFIKASKTA